MPTYRVLAAWDGESHTWIATSPDVPGLCLEAATFEELCDTATALVPELLQANGLCPEAEIPIDVVGTRRTVATIPWAPSTPNWSAR